MDSDNKKDRGGQLNCREPQLIHRTIGHHCVRRSRVVPDMGSIRLSGGVYCTIYAQVCFLSIFFCNFAGSDHGICAAAVHTEDDFDRFALLFILHPRARRRDTVADLLTISEHGLYDFLDAILTHTYYIQEIKISVYLHTRIVLP